jgi:hypothetical protein
MAAPTLEELSKLKSFKVPKGKWRIALFAMAERRQLEREYPDKEHPKPKNSIDLAAYMFLAICETGDVSAVKELANRMDGLPSQEVTLKGDGDAPLFIASAEELRKKIRMPVHDSRNSIH